MFRSKQTVTVAVLAAMLAVTLIGCSSSKKDTQAASTTQTSETIAEPATTTTTQTNAVGDPTPTMPIVNVPNPVALCKAISDVQALLITIGDIRDLRTDGLVVLSVAEQGRASARSIRETTPADVADTANLYADQVDGASQELAAAKTMSAVTHALESYGQLGSDQQFKPLLDWVVRFCVADEPAA